MYLIRPVSLTVPKENDRSFHPEMGQLDRIQAGTTRHHQISGVPLQRLAVVDAWYIFMQFLCQLRNGFCLNSPLLLLSSPCFVRSSVNATPRKPDMALFYPLLRLKQRQSRCEAAPRKIWETQYKWRFRSLENPGIPQITLGRTFIYIDVANPSFVDYFPNGAVWLFHIFCMFTPA